MTISAKNYAAQAEKDLKTINFLSPQDKFKVDKLITKNIASAMHFAMPDYGLIFDDDKKGIQNQKIRLPFPKITIEYAYPLKDKMQNNSSSKRLIYAFEVDANQIKGYLPNFEFEDKDTDKFIFVFSIAYMDFLKKWEVNPFCVLLPTTWHTNFHKDKSITKLKTIESNKTNLQFVGTPIPFLKDTIYKIQKQSNQNIALQIIDEISAEVSVVLELCEALSCSNVGYEPIEKIDPKVNLRRIADGKIPLYETKTLVIKTPQIVSSEQNLFGTHKSPRQHLRRGHIRRLPDKNIWVNATVVGKKENGILDKNYAIY